MYEGAADQRELWGDDVLRFQNFEQFIDDFAERLVTNAIAIHAGDDVVNLS